MVEQPEPLVAQKPGLEDVIAGESEVCFIDGREGRLLYRGYDIHDLVANSTFEETMFLLWTGHLPTVTELSRFTAKLQAARELPHEVMQMLYSLPKSALPMEVLRTAVSMLSSFDLRPDATARDAILDKAIFVTSRMPTIVGAFNNLRNGKTPFHPRNDLSHAANLLYLLRGTAPDEDEAKIMDAALIVHADHEFNASTFAARVTVGTLSDYYSAITSAVGTLKGPLHGGANQDVMNMLLHIGEIENVESYVRNQFTNKKKIPGFGHRVYKLEDPRAQFLRTFAYQLGEKKHMEKWAAMTRRIQDIVQSEKSIYPNVDLYSASVYYALGIPVDMYTCIFAMSRVAGWTAHIIEQYQNNRLIRPASHYIGKTSMKYTPISERM